MQQGKAKGTCEKRPTKGTGAARAPLRVAFVHPDLGIGGAERLVVDAAESLQDRGHTVYILTSHFDASHAFEPTRDGTLEVIHAKTWIPRSLFHMLHLPMAILQQLSLVMQVVVAAYGSSLARHLPHVYRSLTHVPTNSLPDVFVIDQLPTAIPLIKLLCGRRVMYYCHFPDKEISAALARQRGTRGLRALVRAIYRFPLDVLEEATTQWADLIVANSRFTATHFHRVFPRIAKRPSVVYPAVDEAMYTAQHVERELATYASTCTMQVGEVGSYAREHLELVQRVIHANDCPMFFSINRFEAKKNIPLALHTVARLRQQAQRETRVRLVCAGGYDARIRDNIETLHSLQSLADTLGLTHVTLWNRAPPSRTNDVLPPKAEQVLKADVIFLPSLPSALLHALLHAPSLRALLYTPTNEHFGIVPLEAMVCGVPVVATDTGGPLETVLDASLTSVSLHGKTQIMDTSAMTGFLRPPSADAWAAACSTILAWDEGTRAQVAATAKRWVSERFSVRSMGAELEEHLHKIGMQAVPQAERLQILGTMLALVLMHVVAVYVVLRSL